MGKVVSFSGPSNSGKTTLIEKIAKELLSNYKVVILKNDPANKAKFDRKGKDSYRFFQTGADVVVTSNVRTTYFLHKRSTLLDIIKTIREFDFLLIEGYKYLDLPRIVVFRDSIDESYFKYASVFATKNVDNSLLPKKVFDLDDYHSILEWVVKNAKEIK